MAWLSEGSCTDQVASAIAPSSASVISARPASSLKAPPQDVAEMLGDESNGVEAAVDRGI